ncbi:NAD-dependent epimerase/dehydratase family protein [Streptomyces canus]|uniref:NAD-dependent epimerase/dehydratase family protein n=1 Tax=Streptomyces canus TaxID=58343 RepID=UPI002788A997|nr:NAD(P)-dependent oxidoreductase [Streptomyces canus]MDQ0758679.1 UDP-glucose 4-epimerase [Streptomyces canus]
MKVLVTGGAGFIGTWIRRELTARGHSILILDHQDRRQHLADGEEFFLGDVRDATAVTEAAAHVDGIIHLAAVLGTQETISNPRPSAETNILGSLNVFEAATQYGLPVAYAGVGNHAMRLIGTGCYTITKSAAEDLARMYNLYRDGGQITIVRPVNAYGPGQSVAQPFGTSKVRKILPALSCRALTGAPIEVYGDGTQISDCVYVADVARTFVTALEHTAVNGPTERPVEVGPLTSVTVNDIARLVAEYAANVTGREPVGIKHLPMRPGEVPNAVVSSDTSTLAQIGMAAADFVPLDEGIRRTVDYYNTEWLPGYLEQSVPYSSGGVVQPGNISINLKPGERILTAADLARVVARDLRRQA